MEVEQPTNVLQENTTVQNELKPDSKKVSTMKSVTKATVEKFSDVEKENNVTEQTPKKELNDKENIIKPRTRNNVKEVKANEDAPSTRTRSKSRPTT